MFATSFLTLVVLAAVGTVGIPVAQPFDAVKHHVCVLIDGPGGYVIDPYNRPQCTCHCQIVACSYVTVRLPTSSNPPQRCSYVREGFTHMLISTNFDLGRTAMAP